MKNDNNLFVVGIDVTPKKKSSGVTMELIGIFSDESKGKEALKNARESKPNDYVFMRNIDINKDYLKESEMFKDFK